MRVFAPVIEVATLPVFHSWQEFAFGRTIALQLIRDDDAWHVLQPLEQLAKALLRSLLITPALDQDVEHVIVLISGAPQVMALAMDCQKDCIKMPFVPRARPSVL
jgi:hypothetical protein